MPNRQEAVDNRASPAVEAPPEDPASPLHAELDGKPTAFQTFLACDRGGRAVILSLWTGSHTCAELANHGMQLGPDEQYLSLLLAPRFGSANPPAWHVHSATLGTSPLRGLEAVEVLSSADSSHLRVRFPEDSTLATDPRNLNRTPSRITLSGELLASQCGTIPWPRATELPTPAPHAQADFTISLAGQTLELQSALARSSFNGRMLEIVLSTQPRDCAQSTMYDSEFDTLVNFTVNQKDNSLTDIHISGACFPSDDELFLSHLRDDHAKALSTIELEAPVVSSGEPSTTTVTLSGDVSLGRVPLHFSGTIVAEMCPPP